MPSIVIGSQMPSVTISTTAVLIYSGSASRIDVILTNDSAVKCYIGPNSSITPNNTIFLNQNDVWIDDYSGLKGYRGTLYGITSSGTATLKWWERDQ